MFLKKYINATKGPLFARCESTLKQRVWVPYGADLQRRPVGPPSATPEQRKLLD